MQSNLTCTWFEVAANKNHTIFSGRARDTGKLKNKAIFDSQEYERNAVPNLRRWLTTSSRVIRNKMYFNSHSQGRITDTFLIHIPGRLLCYIFIHTYLADFLKTKLVNEICSHLSKKASKRGLIRCKITLTKDKGRRKRKSEDVDRRRGEKKQWLHS